MTVRFDMYLDSLIEGQELQITARYERKRTTLECYRDTPVVL